MSMSGPEESRLEVEGGEGQKQFGLVVFLSPFINDLIDLQKVGGNQICRWCDTGINVKASEPA